MWYRILLGTGGYLAGAGAIAWWLGGIFKRERAALGLPIEHLRAAEEWYALHTNAAQLEEEVHAMEEAAANVATLRHTA